MKALACSVSSLCPSVSCGLGKSEQLDLLFHDIENGTLDQTGDFYNYLKRVKDMHPKPEESDGD